ncbi:hypothetical protein FKM82_023270 [Ascaphus truei]
MYHETPLWQEDGDTNPNTGLFSLHVLSNNDLSVVTALFLTVSLSCPQQPVTVKAPSVSLFPPSAEEISTNKATLVCSLTDFTPKSASVKWTVDGKDQSDGVQTSVVSKQSDNTYMQNSFYTMPVSDWLSTTASPAK